MRGNMKNMMKQMQKCKRHDTSSRKLEQTTFTGVANDDLVKITMNGKREVQKYDQRRYCGNGHNEF